MLAVAFDTLKLARKLESAGFPPKQAQDASAAISESFSEWQANINLATREDVRQSETRLDAQVDVAVKTLDAKIAETNAKVDVAVKTLDAKVDVAVKTLDARIAESKADMIKWVVGMGFAQIITLVFGLLKMHG